MDANGQEAFPGTGRRPASVAELERLKRENARLKEENEILDAKARKARKGHSEFLND